MSATLVEQHATAVKAAKDIVSAARNEQRELSDEENATLEAKTAEIEDLAKKIKSANTVKAVMALDDAEPEPETKPETAAKSLGEHFVKTALPKVKELKSAGERYSISSPEFKASTDTISSPSLSSPTTPNIPQIDLNVVEGFRRRPFLADLLGSATLTGNTNAVTYFTEGSREGDFATVAEAGAKPQIHYTNPTAVTDALKKIAAFFKESDEMIEDLGFMVDAINRRALYDLAILEEAQLLSGAGTGSTVKGLLNRSGIGTEEYSSDDDMADSVFRAMMQVQTSTGLAADGVAINPTDYQTLRLRRDSNEQYYGGGYFQGQYGQGGVEWQLPIWGLRTVVTPGITAGTILVGAFAQGATVYRKGGVRVEATNSHDDDFTNNLVTVRVEERVALAVRQPAAFVEITAGS